MGVYTAHNQGVLQRRLGGRTGGSGSSVAVEIFTVVARSVFEFIAAPGYFHNETNNLSNSIGIGIYENGVLVQWIDNPAAENALPKTYIYHGISYPVNGRAELEKAISAAAGTVIGGYSMIVFCALPYGLWVDRSLGDGGTDKRGRGWWSEGLIPEVRKAFTNECAKHRLPVNTYHYGNRA